MTLCDRISRLRHFARDEDRWNFRFLSAIRLFSALLLYFELLVHDDIRFVVIVDFHQPRFRVAEHDLLFDRVVKAEGRVGLQVVQIKLDRARIRVELLC